MRQRAPPRNAGVHGVAPRPDRPRSNTRAAASSACGTRGCRSGSAVRSRRHGGTRRAWRSPYQYLLLPVQPHCTMRLRAATTARASPKRSPHRAT